MIDGQPVIKASANNYLIIMQVVLEKKMKMWNVYGQTDEQLIE